MSKRILCQLLLPALLLGGGWRVFKQYWASASFKANPGIEGAQAAVSWDPEGAEYHHQLGVLLNLGGQENPEVALRHLRKAAQLNPYDWRAQLDLGAVAERAGRTEEAEKAFGRAVALNPRSAPFRWRAANFYLRSGRLEESCGQAEKLLQLDTSYRPAWIFLLDRMGAPESVIQSQAPRDKASQLQLLKALVKRRDETGYESDRLNIQARWEALLSSPDEPTLQEAAFYINDLMFRGDAERARHELMRVARQAGLQESEFVEGKEAVWNGRFENPFSGVAMDWRADKRADFSYRLSPGEGIDGSQALRIEFPGSKNLDFNGIGQLVNVTGGTTYRLSLWMKTRDISTEQGPFLEIADPETGDALARTEALTGTQDWTQLTSDVHVPAGLKLLALQIRRRPSRRIDNLLRGVVWIDSVSLGAVAESTSIASRSSNEERARH